MIKLLQDAAIFFRDSESLFVDRIKSVVIVGGLETHHRPNGSRKKSSIQLFFNAQRDDQQRTSASFSPDRSEATNAFDLPAAFFFYQRCFDFGVPLIIVKSEVRLSTMDPPSNGNIRWRTTCFAGSNVYLDTSVHF